MSQTHDEIRAVRVMVDALRAEPPPELPWDAIETRLLSRIAERPLTLRRVDSSPALARVLGFAVAAAVLALGIGSIAGSGALPSAAAPARRSIDSAAIALAPGGSVAPGAHDLAALRAGDFVEAGDAPVTFGQAGLATWTIMPGSAVRVRTTGVGHTVVLERGSLRAEVTPRDPAEGLVEAFAVEVAGTRVAVHGTAFSVTLEGGRAIVDVEHGAVTVGPVGSVSATTGHLLVGPSRASFSLDGGRSARLLERTPAPAAAIAASVDDAPAIGPQPGGDRVAARDERPADGALAAAPAPKPSLAAHAPARPAADTAPGGDAPEAVPEPPRLTVDVVRARLDRCFKQTSDVGASTLRVSVSTTLHIELKPDGSVRRAQFTQPLKPELTACAGSVIAGRFADGLDHVDIPVTFQP